MRRAFVILAAMCCASAAVAQEREFGSLVVPEECGQAIVVAPNAEGNGYSATLISYDEGQAIEEYSTRCSVGYGGIAAMGTKREGDGKSPEGVYALRRGLCYVRDFESSLPMELYDEDDMWSEDAESPHYNTLVRNPKPNAKGDRLWEKRATQYRYIVVVEYNTNPVVKGRGSAIFIHAWRGEGKRTAGCIGMAEEDVKRIVEWLDPELNPYIVITRK